MEYAVFLNFVCWKDFSRCYGVLVFQRHMIFIISLLSLFPVSSSLPLDTSSLLSSPLLSSLSLSLLSSFSRSCVVVVIFVLCCRRFYMCAWCCRMCEETQNIKMERKMLREHEKTKRVFIKSLDDEQHTGLVERIIAEGRQEDQSTNDRTAMMRPRGRSISHKCDVQERDLQNSYDVPVKRIFPL